MILDWVSIISRSLLLCQKERTRLNYTACKSSTVEMSDDLSNNNGVSPEMENRLYVGLCSVDKFICSSEILISFRVQQKVMDHFVIMPGKALLTQYS